MASAEAAARFKAKANDNFQRLKSEHDASLTYGDPDGLRRTTEQARIIRRSLIVYRASLDVLLIDESRETLAPRAYLRRTLPQLFTALSDGRFEDLSNLAKSIEVVLDGLIKDENTLFAPVKDVEAEKEAQENLERQGRSIDDEVPIDTDDTALPFESNVMERNVQDKKKKKRNGKLNLVTRFRPKKTGLQKRQKFVLFLYILMVLAAVAAVVIVTIDFVQESKDPSGLISTEVNSTFLTPVVTVCLSQPGIPFSRLQLFNFTDAEGTTFVGADPQGDYPSRVTPEFTRVVDRFWDNPNNESCNDIVGDFFPFPLRSLNRLTQGETSTACRQCYRVGYKEDSFAVSTAFQNSSILNFYTDSYFLQCMKSPGGLTGDGLLFVQNLMFKQREEMFKQNVLTTNTAASGNISGLEEPAFLNVTSEQACNIYYFAFFPKMLSREDPTVDIRYEYNGTAWNEKGRGPYFLVKNTTGEFLPTESLQLFVEGHADAQEDVLHSDADLILIGPNTQTFATFRRLIVFDSERYDISSSTSNLFQSDITPLFGYWLVYRVYYNYNRFVTDEWYQQTTYPVFQWLADVLGYLGLFTGVSVFSLLMLPILRTLQKRDKTKLQQQSPEGYVWMKHKKLLGGSAIDEDDVTESATKSIILPGYNV